MCDTLCALPCRTANQTTVFAKNSDRSPNEPHLVVHIPAKNYDAGEDVALTYRTIPQARVTLEVVLCKPSWIWGAEMGVNAAGVAIGNEAVFTKAKRGSASLIGMDLLRLGLERAASASEAVSVILELLEQYGQGGNCGFDHEFYYDNSFLIADPREGYVLETAGKRYVVEKIEEKRAISNRLTIGTAHTRRGGVEEGFDFAKKMSEPVFTFFSKSKERLQASCANLEGTISAQSMFAALRAHDPRDEQRIFSKGSVRSVCMHAGGLIGDQTTGSLVAELREGRASTLWVTGASTPCISAFKPVFLGIGAAGAAKESEEDAKAYWLKREQIHRGVLAGCVDVGELRAQFAALEKEWIAREKTLFAAGENPDPQSLRTFSIGADRQERELVERFLSDSNTKSARRLGGYWKKKNERLDVC